jgi:predicted acetyltransferase
MIVIRQPTEDERAAVGAVLRFSFNPPAAVAAQMIADFRLDQFQVAFEDDRIVATARTYDLRQWFGGRAVPMAGIASVATVPERRGGGIATDLMRSVMRTARRDGKVISTLYPATVTVYRRLGYEYAGIYTEYRIPTRDLPRDTSKVEVDEFRDEDLEALKACYRRYAATQNGPAEGDDDQWWQRRVLRRGFTEGQTRAAIVRGPDGVEGYAPFALEDIPTDWGYRLEGSHLVATTPAAAGALLGYFRRFASVGMEMAWHGPPNEPLALLIPEQTLKADWIFRNMSRLLDVPAALEARGYPEVDGEATIAVDDPLFEENRGPFRIVAEGGSVKVVQDDVPARRPVPIGLLTALYTGYLSPADLVQLGALDQDDPGLAFLGRLFAGPVPWAPDFF